MGVNQREFLTGSETRSMCALGFFVETADRRFEADASRYNNQVR